MPDEGRRFPADLYACLLGQQHFLSSIVSVRFALMFDIPAAVKRAGIQTPAITLIGEVAKLKETLEWYGGKPLSGKRILVTASHAMTAELEAHITACGGEPVLMSLIETKPIHSKNIDDACRIPKGIV